MSQKQYPVEVQPDFLEKITRARPVQALAELIWNALDADAKLVSVNFEYNDLDTLSAVVVSDDGVGIPRESAPEVFRRLGGSWKRPGASTPGGRFLHGQEGRGRFKAFAIGDFAQWDVCHSRDEEFFSYSISMSASDISHVNITEEKPASIVSRPGVRLRISEPHKDFRSFASASGFAALAEIFALYLADYPEVSIKVDGRPIDPNAVIESRKAFELEHIVVDDKPYPARLEIVEWRGVSNRALYLCNDKRFPLVQTDRRFHVGDFQFTAYLQTAYLTAAQKEGTVELAEMRPQMVAAIDEAQRLIKDYFRNRLAAQARSYVEEWKEERVYPYSGEAATRVEEVERQVFEIVAVSVARHLPDFGIAPSQNKSFQLRMLRQAIEKSPEELQVILNEVLRLPKRKQEELAELLRDVSLAAVISSAKIVADRLKFLNGLDAILFDQEPKKRLKERTQLHRIIAQNCWIFGEEFSLSVDDQSPTEVLRGHRKILGDHVVIDAPVKHVSKERGIVDLMLSKATRRHNADAVTHLVVELKAPKVKINSEEILQIEGYAASVMGDPRFKKVRVNWVFWVISDEVGPMAEFRILNDAGLILEKDNFSVFVKTWGQVLEENRGRMQFFQERLEYQADKGASLAHIQEHYAKYLEGVFDEDATPLDANDLGVSAQDVMAEDNLDSARETSSS